MEVRFTDCTQSTFLWGRPDSVAGGEGVGGNWEKYSSIIATAGATGQRGGTFYNNVHARIRVYNK